MINKASAKWVGDEAWKDIIFDQKYTNKQQLQISNYGKVKSFTKNSEGRILNGSKQGGYGIIRLKFFNPRTPKIQEQLQQLRNQKIGLTKKMNALVQEQEIALSSSGKQHLKHQLEEEQKKLNAIERKYRNEYKKDELKRTVNAGFLTHRVVAEYFCEKPSGNHNLVIHLDFNKLNNYYKNLKWVTQAESTAHQQNSPAVIADKKARPGRRPENSKVYKLTTTKVMLLKKKIREGKSLKLLSKQFKVTETQVLRIKRGENWKDIPAAD